MFPSMTIYQGKGLSWRSDAEDDYAHQTAIFAHIDEGFTANELATRWLEDYSHFFEAGTETKPWKTCSAPQASMSTPSKSLAWKTTQNRRQLRHQPSTAIDFFSRSGPDSMIALIRKLLYNQGCNSESRGFRDSDCYSTLKISWKEGYESEEAHKGKDR